MTLWDMRGGRDESQTKQSANSSVNIYLKNTTERFGFKKQSYTETKCTGLREKGNAVGVPEGTVVNYLHVTYKSTRLFKKEWNTKV